MAWATANTWSTKANENENAACLDSCSAVTVSGTHTPSLFCVYTHTHSHTVLASRPRPEQGWQPERDSSDNVYMLITCENMQQTANNNKNRRQAAICHEVYFFTPTKIAPARFEQRSTRDPSPNPRRPVLLLWVPFKVYLPGGRAGVCAGILITTTKTTTTGATPPVDLAL